MSPKMTGAEIRKTYIDFFVEHGHTYVPSSPLVPGGDATLLFTNAGMVQFKDVFLGTDKRPYTRAVNSQKCMRVAGKHNDLDDVGRDDTHHTFFEMLGNWSFGDYYKKEAIEWAWQLFTEVWGLERERIWATCFKDEYGKIPSDDEAVQFWQNQPGFIPDHVLFFGRKDNFWEMAETGPCGPCSEIHYDRGELYCDKAGQAGHICQVNGNCARYLELWNLVFIQYNRLGPDDLEPLPARHVDTGMGFERIVSVLQDVDSNYKTDLFAGVMDTLQTLTGTIRKEMYSDFTPYRVIADHARSASFLIADGVVPGNIGRNYVCRMIVRRAARFGTKIGLTEPFLAKVASAIIDEYGAFYPELDKHRQAILDNLTREEIRFARTVEFGTAHLLSMLESIRNQNILVLDGESAFNLYATYGLPLEITKDIARENNMDVDEPGFRAAMDEHRVTSGSGKAMGDLGGEDADIWRGTVESLQESGRLASNGVRYDPYQSLEIEGELLALFTGGSFVDQVSQGDYVEVLLPETGFYVESGGQISDTGTISSYPDKDGVQPWKIQVKELKKPSAGVIAHVGSVLHGSPKVGDRALIKVDLDRRLDIMRNHTATHLLHAALHQVLGEHARQAGSLVAPDRIRFDFNHPEAMTPEQLEQVERFVNAAIARDMPVIPQHKSRDEAITEGAMALFGEKYDDSVRTVTIGLGEDRHSYELCGGTHLERTGNIGTFIILTEGSAAAGVRRIEAVTGRGAYSLISKRLHNLNVIARTLATTPDIAPQKVRLLIEQNGTITSQIAEMRLALAQSEFVKQLENVIEVDGISVFSILIPGVDADMLRSLSDKFRDRYPQMGICVLGSVIDDRPIVIAAITKDLVDRGLSAVELVKFVAGPLGGGGGGKPILAQAGGKDATRLQDALLSVSDWINSKNI